MTNPEDPGGSNEEFKSPFADDEPPRTDDTMMLSDMPGTDAPPIPDVEIRYEIGRGGMGVVYRGTQSYLSRDVAVKVLDGTKQGPEFARRFQREATILASLSHRNIVSCHHAGVTDDGRCFLVMEYIDGPDLRERLDEGGALDTDEALRITADLAGALAYAKEKGVIHRDVKPANVLLQKRKDGGYETKLVDLGLARPESRADQTMMDITVAGAVMGSPATMAPEQFDDPDKIDYRADIYGLGCVLFHSLTGRVAYPQKTLTETIARKMQEQCPDPRDLRKDLPAELAAFIRKMIAKRPEDRPQSYEEVLRDVERLRSSAAAGATADVPRSSSALPWVATGVLLVGAVGVGAWAAGVGPFGESGPSAEELARQAELDRQREAERLAELEAEREAERQAELEREREAERQAELEREREAERQAELDRQREAERQVELEREREAERAAEAERQRLAAIVAEEAERERLTPPLEPGEEVALFTTDSDYPLPEPWAFSEGDGECASIHTETVGDPILLSWNASSPFDPVSAARPLPRGPWRLDGAFLQVGPRATKDKRSSVTLGFEGDVELVLAQVRATGGTEVTFVAQCSGTGAPEVGSELALPPVELEPTDALDRPVALVVEALDDGDVRVSWGVAEDSMRAVTIPADLVGERMAPRWLRLGTECSRTHFFDFRLSR